MEIKFNSDDKLPLNKTIEIPSTIIVVHNFLRLMWIQVIDNIKMLYFDSIDVSEGVDVNKSSASKECDTSHYCYFLNKSFKFQPNICNRCHDLLMMSINFSYIPIFNIKGSNYWCTINGISKSEEIKLL